VPYDAEHPPDNIAFLVLQAVAFDGESHFRSTNGVAGFRKVALVKRPEGRELTRSQLIEAFGRGEIFEPVLAQVGEVLMAFASAIVLAVPRRGSDTEFGACLPALPSPRSNRRLEFSVVAQHRPVAGVAGGSKPDAPPSLLTAQLDRTRP
jgi:hypothetical protein